MIKFKFDEEIEVSDDKMFFKSRKARFVADISKSINCNSVFNTVVLSDTGSLSYYKYARKIEPKVMVILYGKGSTAQTRQIPQSLADKILAGEV